MWLHFLFRLCLHFRIRHPELLSQSMTCEQIADWWMYYQCDPWGDQRDDYRAFFASRGTLSEDVQPEWPYFEAGFTPEEILAARGEL